MATPVILPVQGNTVETCQIVEWLVDIGTVVKSGDILCAVETDKAVFELESPADGTILDIFFKVSDDVPVLTNLAVIGEPGENFDSLRPQVLKREEANTQTEKSDAEPVGKKNAWYIPEKVAFSEKERSGDDVIRISPRAKHLAESKGVPVRTLRGSGPQGRIIEKDILTYLNVHAPLTSAARSIILDGFAAPRSGSGPGGRILRTDMQKEGEVHPEDLIQVIEIPLKGMRKLIADRMKASLQSTAQLTLHTSAEVSALLGFRKKLKENEKLYKKYAITINDLILFVASRVLPKHINLNAHLVDEKILQYKFVNLGFAVDTPRGLIVPVIQDAHLKSLIEISAETRRLSQVCIKGNISPDELQGATFTITNLGAFNIETFTPVINLPQVAILGVGNIQQKAVPKDESFLWLPHIGLSLTIDHQVVDGAAGARFLQDMVNLISDPELLLTPEKEKMAGK